MTPKFLLSIFTIFCFLTEQGCKSPKVENLLRDTVVRNVPGTDAHLNFWYSSVRNTEKEIGLDSLNGGGDSIQIRFWAGGMQGLINFMAIVKGNHDHFIGEFYNYEISRDYRGASLANIARTAFVVDKSFFDSLVNLNVLSMLNSPSHGTDGYEYCVQIATPSSYRFYTCWCPELHRDTASRQLSQIAEMLTSRGGYRPPDDLRGTKKPVVAH